MLVLLARIAKPVGKLLGLLCVELLLIPTIGSLSFTDLIDLGLQGLVLDFSQGNLVFKSILDAPNCMSVVEVVVAYLLIEGHLLSQTSLQISNSCLEILRFQVKLLLSHGPILLETLHCVIKQCFLVLQHLHQLLRLRPQSVNVFVRKHDCLDDSTCCSLRALSKTAPRAASGSTFWLGGADSILSGGRSSLLCLLLLRSAWCSLIFWLLLKLFGNQLVRHNTLL